MDLFAARLTYVDLSSAGLDAVPSLITRFVRDLRLSGIRKPREIALPVRGTPGLRFAPFARSIRRHSSASPVVISAADPFRSGMTPRYSVSP